MTGQYYVYALLDPRRADQPFYIGKGKKLRWKQHLRETYANTLNRRKWCRIEAIRRAGLEVGVAFLSSGLLEAAAYEMEASLIASIGRIGHGGTLTNMCIDRRPPKNPGRPMSAETKKKMTEGARRVLTGRKNGPPPEETRRKISDGLLKANRDRNAEQKALWVERNERANRKKRGRKVGPMPQSTREKLSNARIANSNPFFGRSHTDNAKERIRIGITAAAREFWASLKPQLDRGVRAGAKSQKDLTDYFNRHAIPTKHGKRWNANAISHAFKMMGLDKKAVFGGANCHQLSLF